MRALVGYFPRMRALALVTPRRLIAKKRAAVTAVRGFSTAPSTLVGSGERPKCVVLHCTPPRASPDGRQLEEYLRQEADALVETLGFEVALSETVRMRKYHPRTFVGKGKLTDLRGIVAALGAATVFINTPFLTALQQRHLAQALNAPVRDRMMVILAIFASRARTSEAKLQVELAWSKYAPSHLVRGAEASYAQQRGGVGFIFGGGEKALELRRRDLRDHIKGLQDKLKVVKRRREEQRKHRRQSTVSLVGYTNVGKSTLLNRLTGGDAVSVMDRPFETLDTTTRGLFLPDLGVTTLLTGTVGFISDLPHDLVASFRATLEEVVAADVLLVVRDASTIGTPLFEAQRASVYRVLREIGTTPAHLGQSVVEVWNKVDAVQGDAIKQDELQRRLFEARQHRERDGNEDDDEDGDSSSLAYPRVVPVSARTGEGLPELKAVIAERLLAGGHAVARKEEDRG